MRPEELSCEEVIEQLFAFLDHELDEDLSQQIHRHLALCRDCFTRAEFERRLSEKVAAAAAREEAPQRLRARIRALLDDF